ncbi:MAG: type IV secretion system lipoprotein VirB7 [Acetobacteraceae bacterium]
MLIAGLLAGCSDGEPLPQARGSLFPLNAGLWNPTPSDLAQVPKVAQQ